MTKALNKLGIFDYLVEGPDEDAAAEELEARIDALSRSGGIVAPEAVGAIRREIERKYAVRIKTTVDAD